MITARTITVDLKFSLQVLIKKLSEMRAYYKQLVHLLPIRRHSGRERRRGEICPRDLNAEGFGGGGGQILFTEAKHPRRTKRKKKNV